LVASQTSAAGCDVIRRTSSRTRGSLSDSGGTAIGSASEPSTLAGARTGSLGAAVAVVGAVVVRRP
jgi:hypothetical protein